MDEQQTNDNPGSIICPCQYCAEYITFIFNQAGTTMKCPRCSEITKLFVPITPIRSVERESSEDWKHIPHGAWENEPISEKQKGMFLLYGIHLKEGLTKGAAAKLIDLAIGSGATPSISSQAAGGRIFAKARLDALTTEISKAIRVIGDETAPITQLKETKKKVKQSVKELTDIIDKRIEGIQSTNRDQRSAILIQSLRDRGLI
jgi:hypothetical protein